MTRLLCFSPTTRWLRRIRRAPPSWRTTIGRCRLPPRTAAPQRGPAEVSLGAPVIALAATKGCVRQRLGRIRGSSLAEHDRCLPISCARANASSRCTFSSWCRAEGVRTPLCSRGPCAKGMPMQQPDLPPASPSVGPPLPRRAPDRPRLWMKQCHPPRSFSARARPLRSIRRLNLLRRNLLAPHARRACGEESSVIPAAAGWRGVGARRQIAHQRRYPTSQRGILSQWFTLLVTCRSWASGWRRGRPPCG